MGPSVSSSTFVDNARHRENLFEVLGAETVDMESSAFMHVCASNNKPCGVVSFELHSKWHICFSDPYT